MWRPPWGWTQASCHSELGKDCVSLQLVCCYCTWLTIIACTTWNLCVFSHSLFVQCGEIEYCWFEQQTAAVIQTCEICVCVCSCVCACVCVMCMCVCVCVYIYIYIYICIMCDCDCVYMYSFSGTFFHTKKRQSGLCWGEDQLLSYIIGSLCLSTSHLLACCVFLWLSHLHVHVCCLDTSTTGFKEEERVKPSCRY